jgi:small-conductance mechanosensitive channel
VLHAIVAACQRPAAFALPMLALQLVWQVADDELRFIQSIRHLNGLLVLAALTWLAMAAISGLSTGVIARNPADVQDNLRARRIHTQARVLARTAMTGVFVAGLAMALMTFPGARQLGASLLASAGVIGLIAGIAARPVFSNLISGLQIALAQPIRLDDVLIVNGEWGRVEEIAGTYVVLRIWDERRLIIPLQWFIENPFENWTRSSSQLLGTAFLYVDFTTPIEPLRAELQRIVEAAPEWDGRVCTLAVTDISDRAVQVRCLVSAASSGDAFELRCRVREQMLAFLQLHHPRCLPQFRLRREEGGASHESAVHYPAGGSSMG